MGGKTLKIGGRYNWRGQAERLIYVGKNWSGNGYWHQFEKIDNPGEVWCEVLESDLDMLVETAPPTHHRNNQPQVLQTSMKSRKSWSGREDLNP